MGNENSDRFLKFYHTALSRCFSGRGYRTYRRESGVTAAIAFVFDPL
jgi:hypothetical protein